MFAGTCQVVKRFKGILMYPMVFHSPAMCATSGPVEVERSLLGTGRSFVGAG